MARDKRDLLDPAVCARGCTASVENCNVASSTSLPDADHAPNYYLPNYSISRSIRLLLYRAPNCSPLLETPHRNDPSNCPPLHENLVTSSSTSSPYTSLTFRDTCTLVAFPMTRAVSTKTKETRKLINSLPNDFLLQFGKKQQII